MIRVNDLQMIKEMVLLIGSDLMRVYVSEKGNVIKLMIFR